MLRVGLIGAGVMGRYYARALSENTRAHLVAICDVDHVKAARLAADYGVEVAVADYRALLDQVPLDAMVVATPDFAHTEPVIACLEAGKHVLVEKPLTTNLLEGQAIVEAAARSGRSLMVNFGNRHRPPAQMLKRRMETDDARHISYAYVRLNEKLSKTLTLAWLDRTSPIWFLLSHCVDLLCWLLDTRVSEVSCFGVYGALRGRGHDVPDGVVCTTRLGSGAIACFESLWILPDSQPAPVDFRVELVGASGSMEVDFFQTGLCRYGDRADVLDWGFEELDAGGIATGWWFKSVRYFVECLERGETPTPTAAEGLEVTRVLLAMQESASSGRPVLL